MQPKLTDIIVSENRQRREFDEASIVDLSRSIQHKGLLHPIVCRRDRDNIVLVAGERRLRACKMLIELGIPIVHNETVYFDGTVPITFLQELSLEDAFEAELEENILRVNITWQEHADAVAKLHKLRQVQNGSVQSLVNTASEIVGREATSQDVRNLHQDLTLAKYLDDEQVAKAPSKKEALKIIEKKLKTEHRAKLAEAFNISQSPHTLIHGNSLEQLSDYRAESFDCLCTDPPYGIDAENFGSNFSLQHTYADSWIYFLELSKALAKEAYRLLKPNAHAYVFCSFDGFRELQTDFTAAGFKVWPQPLIWAKGNGNAPWVNQGHKRTYECILYAVKGQKDVNMVKADVLVYPPVANRDHGAEKPVELLVDLLQRSTNPGDKILDPFAGSGSIFSAADEVSCTAVGIELDKNSYNLALLRLEKLL